MNDEVMKAITTPGPKPVGPNMAGVQNWFWKFVPVDPLVFGVPVHDGSAVQIARQVYHRLLSRMVAESAYSMQLGIIALAWVVTIVLGEKLHFKGGASFGYFLGLAAFVGFLFFVVPVLMRMACSASATNEVQGIIRRTFFREVPENTPPDLRDEIQQGWLTVDGRPLSSEISAEDARTAEAARRSMWWILTAIAVGWAVSDLFTGSTASAAAAGPLGPDAGPDALPGMPGMNPLSALGFGGFGFLKIFGSFVVLAILLWKIFRDKRPMAMRAHELMVAEAAEGSAYVAAGGQPWGTIPETARKRQIAEAARDKSPMVELGQTTGIFAARGDYFGPNANLPFRLSLKDLQMHMLVLGGTGSGKTSGVLRPFARQLSACQGVGLVIMDGKGALPGELADLPGMHVIDPSQPGVDISLVSGVEPAVIVDTIREVLAPNSGGENQFFINSAAGALRRGAIIAQAAGGPWWSLFLSAQVVSHKEDRDRLIDALVPKAENDPLLKEAFAYFKNEWDTMDERTRSNILAEIRSWLSTITSTPELLRWAKTPAGKDTVDLMAPLTGGRIGILIPEYKYGVAGSVVSALLKARLFGGLKARATRDWSGTDETPVAFIVDEAQEIATTQDAQMLPIGRSLGLAMIAATQGIEGITAKLGEAQAPKWLSIFGSVVALGGRSADTDAFVAQRAGESWQLTPHTVIGNTVRGTLAMEAMSGPIAAARTQPHMAMTVASGGVAFMPSALSMAANAASQGQAGPKMIMPAQLALGSRLLFPPGEIASLAAVPDTAIVLATRGRVARRDLVVLRPEYPTAKAQAAKPRLVAQQGAPREIVPMAAAPH